MEENIEKCHNNEKVNSQCNIEIIGEKYSKEFKAYKVILIGLSGSGKSSITMRIVKKQFFETIPPTIRTVVKITPPIISVVFRAVFDDGFEAALVPLVLSNSELSVFLTKDEGFPPPNLERE